jgi:hypothetical protein
MTTRSFHKRFAANLIYSSKGFVRRQVIEIDKKGKVIDCYPFKREIEQTIWLKGSIYLHEQKYSYQQINHQRFAEWLNELKPTKECSEGIFQHLITQNTYFAYHLPTINLRYSKSSTLTSSIQVFPLIP